MGPKSSKDVNVSNSGPHPKKCRATLFAYDFAFQKGLNWQIIYYETCICQRCSPSLIGNSEGQDLETCSNCDSEMPKIIFAECSKCEKRHCASCFQPPEKLGTLLEFVEGFDESKLICKKCK